jgi:hypothetical protein
VLRRPSTTRPCLSINTRPPRFGKKTPTFSHDFEPREHAFDGNCHSGNTQLSMRAKSSFCPSDTRSHHCISRSSRPSSDLLPPLLLLYTTTHHGWPNHLRTRRCYKRPASPDLLQLLAPVVWALNTTPLLSVPEDLEVLRFCFPFIVILLATMLCCSVSFSPLRLFSFTS